MTLSSTNTGLKVVSQTMNSRVYERLLEQILLGGLSLGQRLDERALAESLGVSRTPIRDAISNLVKDGLVEHRPYQGNFVRSFSRREVKDLFQLRAELEAMAARLAAENCTDEYAAALAEALESAIGAQAVGDMVAYGEADRRMHDVVASCASNFALQAALHQLDQQIRLSRGVANRDPATVTRTMDERRRIVSAITAQDAATAAAAMREHIEGLEAAIMAQID